MVDNAAIKKLQEPYEIFEMLDGETRELRVKSFELGSIDIKTSEVPQGKTITALRVFVPIEFKSVGVNWFDITSKTLTAQLLGYLQQPDFDKRLFVIKKFGVAPKARFTVQVLP
jgi:hypothetical protein